MNNLETALKQFIEKAENINAKGKALRQEQVRILQQSTDLVLPDWYTNMVLNYPIFGIELEIYEAEYENKSIIEISSFQNLLNESNEAYPGLEARKYGYINFGSCLQGSGDPIFINLTIGDNPPVVRLYHDDLLKDKTLENGGGHIIANSISEFLTEATIFEIPDFSEYK